MFKKIALALGLFMQVSLFSKNTEQQTHRILQFENEQVKVWKTVIMPHQPLKMHRHDFPRVVVGLKGGTLNKIEETGEESDLILETGKAYWLDADPIGELHGDINESDEPIEVMVIEFKPADWKINTENAQRFQKEFDEQYFEINHNFEKLRHILLHLMKTTGKMATYCEVMEHGKIMPGPGQLINEVCPDLLIHALQIANYYQIDLGEKYNERIQFIINRSRNG